MTETEARNIRTQHDAMAKTLTRASKANLKRDYDTIQRAFGFETVHGGPASKDELIGAILDISFPRAAMDEASHVLYHKPGENWSACEHCADGRADAADQRKADAR